MAHRILRRKRCPAGFTLQREGATLPAREAGDSPSRVGVRIDGSDVDIGAQG